MTPVIVADSLTYRFGHLAAVSEASFQILPGVSALLGPNGAGKSTLLRLLATASSPASGEFRYEGRVIAGKALREYRSNLGYLPQQPTWHSWMTVEETVTYFAWMRGVRRRERRVWVDDALASVGIADQRKARLGSLSGGMVQRALLAQAIVHRPSVLILDEPSAGLDPEQRFELRRILREIHPGGVVLISTHILDDVTPLADRLLIMNHGRICFEGSLSDVAGSAGALDKTSEHSSELESAYLKIIADQSN
jgi:ABC-2 type transport system ATP-binding protein